MNEANVPALPVAPPWLSAGGWHLHGLPEAPLDHPLLPAWKKALVGVFETTVQALSQTHPLPPGTAAHVLVCGDQAGLDWGVDEDALGFQGLVMGVVDPDTDEVWDVSPNDHRCYVNLEALLRQDARDVHDVLAALCTVPHEMAHVAWFVADTQGVTPAQVLDQDGVEGFEAIAERIDNDVEDRAEAFGAAQVDRWAADHQAEVFPGDPTLSALRRAAPAPSRTFR